MLSAVNQRKFCTLHMLSAVNQRKFCTLHMLSAVNQRKLCTLNMLSAVNQRKFSTNFLTDRPPTSVKIFFQQFTKQRIFFIFVDSVNVFINLFIFLCIYLCMSILSTYLCITRCRTNKNLFSLTYLIFNLTRSRQSS